MRGINNNNWKLFCSELTSITRVFILQKDLKKDWIVSPYLCNDVEIFHNLVYMQVFN